MKKDVFSDYYDFLDDDFFKSSKSKTKTTSSKSKISIVKKTSSNAKQHKKAPTITRNSNSDIDEFDFLSTTSKNTSIQKKQSTTKPKSPIKKSIVDSYEFDFEVNPIKNVTRTTQSNTNISLSQHTNSQSQGGKKFHIVINPNSGKYTLLDSNLNIVDSMESNPLFSFFTQKYKLHKFKKQLKMDFKLYIKSCRKINQLPDSNFKKMYKKTKFYLSICPDADYQILELLRNNVTRINPNYGNYQTACAEYLYELAKYMDGNPDNMPFDINFSCDKVKNTHAYIAYKFAPSSDPVHTYKTLYIQKNNIQSEFQSNIRCDTKVPNTKFTNVRKVRTPIAHDDRI